MKRMPSITRRTVVCYHAQCLDGFAGAWAAWLALGSGAEYRALKHERERVPAGIEDADVIFIDYCYSRAIMQRIKKAAHSVTIIDHHESHKDVLDVADHARYAVRKSGCILAWEYFHPRKKKPKLLLTIQDHDLFTLKRVKTLEYAAALFLVEFDFASWSRLTKQFETKKKRAELAALGSHLLRYREKFVARLMEGAQPVRFHGIRAYAVNTDIFYSEAAVRIYKTRGVSMGIAWYYKDGKIKVSLRSDGTVDVSRLAARYGGGGHKGAAAFWTPCPASFPWAPSRAR